ncbi:peptidoglycan DD-metalloendopeptidase family protein [Sphingomonas silueang]|uniref:peptidoglycan DD-metalloendopeptidase family protein n=1 Tax=Sphingomonas silueang TaxID=3156617 RepID=UPI0032B59037
MIVALSLALQAASAPLLPGLFEPATEGTAIEEIVVAPVFHEPFSCSQHASGQEATTGDALGTDCAIEGGTDASGVGFRRPFRTNGARNEDWYGWQADIHAPIGGTVRYVRTNPLTNPPGVMGRDPASVIVITAADGTNVVLAHTDRPRVKVGDVVVAGDVVAQVGNNGFSHAPHIHIGAYRGATPLQIRWDLRAMGKVPALS